MNECYPIRLDEEEINDPHLVISRFFDYASLPHIREYLWHWLKITVSGTFSDKIMDKRQRYDLVYLYEHIEKLIEAAHLMHLRQLELKTTCKQIEENEEESKPEI